MALYLTISEGDTPSNIHPIFATRDPQIIRAVASEVGRRLGITIDKSKTVLSLDKKLKPSSADSPSVQDERKT